MSDTDIRAELESGRLVCAPLAESAIQPASIDVRLGSQFRVFVNHRHAYIDVRDPQSDLTELEVIQGDEPFVLHPGEFVLATTVELVKIPDYLVARVEGKSSLGRLGLLVHATAGFVDPGFDGRLTLELSNVASLPIRLYANMKIGQLSFQHLTSPAEHPYGHPALGSRYQGQDLPTASRMYRDFSRS